LDFVVDVVDDDDDCDDGGGVDFVFNSLTAEFWESWVSSLLSFLFLLEEEEVVVVVGLVDFVADLSARFIFDRINFFCFKTGFVGKLKSFEVQIGVLHPNGIHNSNV